jgi:sugar O-acyltransferase (sialic acid O-acetyltransferase NeuD family)
MKKSLIIVGTGAVAAEITSLIEDTLHGALYEAEIKGYLDIDDAFVKRYEYKKPYLGTTEAYSPEEKDYFIVAIGNNTYRKENAEVIIAKGGKFTNLIHPTCIIANTAKIGEGNIINPFSMVGPKAKIGDFNVITSQSFISHDCEVGDFNFFSTVGLCGHVEVGNENTFNVRATVIPHVKIGNKNLIQAGMIVDKNVDDDATIFHRFKEKVIAIPKPDKYET